MASIPSHPAVVVNETDLSTRVSNGNVTSFGAIAINSEWGPADQIVLVDSEKTFVDTFGRPSDVANTYVDFFVATNFLSYSASLNVVRTVSDTALNAVSGNTTILVKNSDEYLEQTFNYTNGSFVAKYPGSKGNSLFVVAVDSSSPLTANLSYTYYGDVANTSVNYGSLSSYVNTIPGTSTHADSVGGLLDEVHILVFDNLGSFSGTTGTLLEKYEYVSLAYDAKKEDGTSNYYKNLINTGSRYIWIGEDLFSANSTTDIKTQFTPTSLSANTYVSYSEILTGGVDSTNISSGDYITSYELFDDKKTVSVSHLIAGNVPTEVTQTLVSIAEDRGDCAVYVSPRWSDVQIGQTQSAISTNIKTFKNTALNVDSSYCFIDGNWKYQYDKYNDVNRWIPCCGDTAGLKAKAELDNDPWWNGSGYNRGLLRNTIKLAWNPKETYMGEIYKNSVNPIISEGGRFVLLGDKTSLVKPSAFDRINVRSLFNTLKTKISDYLKYALFDFNDEFTREQLSSHVEVYLQQVKSRRGIEAFQVVCDASNNTEYIRDNNQLIMDVYIKPSKSINWIVLNMVNVGTSVSFNEVIGKI